VNIPQRQARALLVPKRRQQPLPRDLNAMAILTCVCTQHLKNLPRLYIPNPHPTVLATSYNLQAVRREHGHNTMCRIGVPRVRLVAIGRHVVPEADAVVHRGSEDKL